MTVLFNNQNFKVRRTTFGKTSTLVAELQPQNESIEMNLPNVNCNTFDASLSFFNTGFIPKNIHDKVCLLELILLSDYMQAALLYDFCCKRFLKTWSKTISKDIFHHTVIPFHIFNNLCTSLRHQGNDCILQLWSQYTSKHKKYEAALAQVFIVDDQASTTLANIDLHECSFSSIKGAELKMPVHVFQKLCASGLIRKLSRLHSSSKYQTGNLNSTSYRIPSSEWDNVFSPKQAENLPVLPL